MNRHNRQSIRLKGYDYAQAGAYYVTVCVQDRKCPFGNVNDGKMMSNDAGKIVNDSWRWLGDQYEYVELDEFIVMPNHIHGIICVNDAGRGGSRTAPTIKRKPLGRLIGAFKTVSTKQINITRQTSGNQLWQRNYYEHIIRGEDDLIRIREYIINNPARWEQDDYYVK